MIAAWFRRRREARAAAHEREIARLRERFKGEPEYLINAIASGGMVAACALQAINLGLQQQAKDEHLRKIIREELDAWQGRRDGA